MTLYVYHYDEYGNAKDQYVLGEGNEFTGLLMDGVTHITARAGKENEGFMIIYPTNIESIIGKKAFREGDVLALNQGYELAADIDDSDNE